MRPFVMPTPDDGLTFSQRFFRDARVFYTTPGGKLIYKLRRLYKKRRARLWKNSLK